MKPLTFITKNFKNILIGVLIVVLIIALNKCSNRNKATEKLQSQLAALTKEKQLSDKSLDSILKKHRSDSADWKGKEILADMRAHEADNQVKQQQRTIDRLAAKVRQTNNQPIDTANAVLVSKAYKDACDSFPPENDKLRAQLAEKDTAINQWTNILTYEVEQRDSTIDALRLHITRVDDLYNRQNKLVEDAIAKSKPRGRLLAGLGILGNQKQFLSGFSGVIAYQSKGGKQYQVSPKFLKHPASDNAELFWEGSVLITLFK